jgi:hypothetical protein
MAVGVAWYREADWHRIKELFPDADQLHDTHAEWLKFAEESVKRLTRTGMTVEPVVIDIDDFLGWCLIHNRARDAKARTEYVTEKLSHNFQTDPTVFNSIECETQMYSMNCSISALMLANFSL